MSIKNVCLLGADGTLGPSMLEALVNDKFNVTVLKRQSSKSPSDYPAGVKVAKFDDKIVVEELAEILQGQDALVVTIKGTQVDIQKRLADACIKAGVSRLIPADFGSCDSSSEHAQECVPLFGNKTEIRAYLADLAKANKNFTWTSLVCGHFFDWDTAFLHVWPKDKRVDILDNGDVKASYSTLSRAGFATSRILQKPTETANKVLFVQSFSVTQQDIIKSFEKASGEKWTAVPHDSVEYERAEKVKRDAGDKEALENLVWFLGALESNWELKKDEFAMELLGLEDESLDEAVAAVWKQQK